MCGPPSRFIQPQAFRSTCIRLSQLVTAGVEMDVLGMGYTSLEDTVRNAIVRQSPRTPHFKEDIWQAFYDGIKHSPIPHSEMSKRMCWQTRSIVPKDQLLLVHTELSLERLNSEGGHMTHTISKSPRQQRALHRKRSCS